MATKAASLFCGKAQLKHEVSVDKPIGVIYFHNKNDAIFSWITEAQVVVQGDHDALKCIAPDYRWIAIVPQQEVVLTSVTLPKMSRSKLAQALPYALEENTATDVEKLHFALGKLNADGSIPVAIVAHEVMQSWLQSLNALAIAPIAFIPTALALPYTEKTWSISLDQHFAIVRTGAFSGFSCDIKNVAPYLKSAMLQPPRALSITQLNPLNEEIDFLHDYGVPISKQTLTPVAWLQTLQQVVLCDTPLSLLQRAYAVKKTNTPRIATERLYTRYVLMIWFALLFVYPTFSYFMLHSEQASLNARIDHIYAAQFPNAKQVVAPLKRMQAKARAIASDGADNPFLAQMAALGKAMQPGIQFSELSYNNNALTLTLSATDAALFTQFNQLLTEQGFKVKQQNATVTGSIIHATLVITS